ncbi:hypothetical protein M0R45_009907 [Rubus argutus]|uniref:Secreted protein n=1 Tax=Rubus argutus TaxID=59490 RepID=A0AAW1Y5S6_RUBAR
METISRLSASPLLFSAVGSLQFQSLGNPPPLLQSPGFTSICAVDPRAVPALNSPSHFLSDRRCHHHCFPQTSSSFPSTAWWNCSGVSVI